jgi:5'(3')-deoxyribonucleotidase
MDGVLYEFERTARYMLREYRGVTVPESSRWDYLKDNVTRSDWRWLWKEGVSLGLFRYGHMVTGARIGLHRITGAGHSVCIVTHRPKHATADTVDWLSLYLKDIPYDGLSILSNQESKTSVEADILIDDKPQNISDWVQEDRPALLFSRPWNTDHSTSHPLVVRAVGWRDAANVVILNAV